VVPVDTHIRFIVTARDVIHSFAVPSLGVKLDCIPGRLNQFSLVINREGVFYGQCSELCGVLHGFMPVVIEAVSLEQYLAWLSDQISPLFNQRRLYPLYLLMYYPFTFGLLGSCL
jgi:cytochrome c oxidase subunit 2